MNGTRHIVCGQCARINRIPSGRAAAEARCGSCHEPLFTGRPIEVDEARFERHLTRSDVPLLVDVWALWCGPCHAMAPMFAKAAQILEPDVQLLKLNSDAAPTVSARLGIQSIPTLLLTKGGHVIARSSGVINTERIVAWARANLGVSEAA